MCRSIVNDLAEPSPVSITKLRHRTRPLSGRHCNAHARAIACEFMIELIFVCSASGDLAGIAQAHLTIGAAG